MARTLLDICQDVALRIGYDTPSIVVNGDPSQKQLLRLVLESGRDLVRRHDWQVLEKLATFTSTAVELQATITSAWPGFRRIKKNTFLNVTRSRRLRPVDAENNATLTLHSGSPASYTYRIRGNQILFPGNTTSGDSCQFEYVSHYWVTSSDGVTYRAIPTADTDLILLDDEAIILGAKWRWKKEQGLAYGEDFTDYEKLVQELMGSDREAADILLGGMSGNSSLQFGNQFPLVIPTS